MPLAVSNHATSPPIVERVVATGNITLSGLSTIDSVTPVAGDRVLAVAQTTASQNGVYVAASGAWARALDADQNGEITPGSFWFVEEGTTFQKTQWRCNNTGTITIGTTAITIVQFGAAASYTASFGVQLVGSDFSIKLNSTYSGLVTDANGLRIDIASTIAVARITRGTITGDGSTTVFNADHNLNTKRIVPSFQDSSDNGVDIDWATPTVSRMALTFGTAPPNGTVYNWTVTG